MAFFINAKDIGNAYYHGLSDFLEVVDDDVKFNNVKEELNGTFGVTFATEIFTPVLQKLLCVDSLNEIVTGAHLRFGLKRLKVLNEASTKLIKNIPSYDARMSYHTTKDALSTCPLYYPSKGGVGQWTLALEKKLRDVGVKILCGRSILGMDSNDKTIQSLTLDDGVKVNCDILVWTVPLIFLFRAAEIKCKTERPSFVHTTLFHYVIDQPPLNQNHYLYCYEPNLLPFRVTLYSNLQSVISANTERHRVTVEVLSKEALDLENSKKDVWQDLIKMKLVAKKSNVLFQHTECIQQGFPKFTHEFVKSSKYQYDLAMDSFSNLSIQGKSNTKDWFMNDIFKSIYAEFGK